MKKVVINIDNRVYYILLAMMFVLVLGLGVYALAPSIDTGSGYHESNKVSITVSGVEKTLQEAIDDQSLGGGSISSGAIMAFNLGACPTGWSNYITGVNRMVVGSGGSYALETTGGASTVTLTTAQIPSHTHRVYGRTGISNQPTVVGGAQSIESVGAIGGLGSWYISNQQIEYTGGGGSHNNMPPYVALLYCQKD